MYGYIYKTTNLINGKIYVGKKTKSEFDPDYKGSGKILKLAFKKYGWENFEVEFLCPCFSLEELNAEERCLIAHFDSRNPEIGYNRSEGGDWGDISGAMTPEEYKLWNKRKSIAQRGKRFSQDHKAKISSATKGHRNHCYGKRGPQSHNYGKKHPDRSYNRICVDCGSTFVSGSNQTKYCPSCKQLRSLPKNPNRIFQIRCPVCGSLFSSYSNNPRQKCDSCKIGGS